MKKQLQSLAVALMAVAGFSNQASALNSYAYGMGATLSEDAATLNVTYSLNADATAVAVVFYNGTEVVKTVDLDAANFTAGAHAVDVATEGLPQGAQITWAVKATSAVVETPTEFEQFKKFYHPQGVAVDNNTESPYFGRIYLTECMNSKAGYNSGDTGKGLYIYDPQLNPVLNAKGQEGFIGMQNFEVSFPEGGTVYDPRKVRLSDDGRLFVSGQNTYGVALWEVNPADPDAEWTKVLAGTTNDQYQILDAEGNVMCGPNISFDVKGTGEDLTILTHSAAKSTFGFSVNDVWTQEFKLGTQKTWTAAPTKIIDALSEQYSITASNINVLYDENGEIWYFQYRATPTEEQPAIKHVNKDGVEDFSDITYIVRGGGAAYNDDFTLLAMADQSKSCGIFEVLRDESGKVTGLKNLYSFATNIGGNLNDIAWDKANNLYICGNSGEFLKVFALPRANGDVTIAAPTAAAFTLPAAPEPEPQPELVYNLKEVSKLTEGLPVKGEARQAALGKDGKIYIHDKANQLVEVWTMDGKTTEVLAEAGVNTSVTTDDAGNVIVPGAGYEFPGAAFNNLTSLKVYPADGSAAVEVAVSGMPAGRTDFLGHIYGNILAGEAVMYVPAKDTQDVVAVRFFDGAQDGDAVVLTLSNANPADNMTVAHADANGFMYHRRGAKASVRLVKAEYDDAMGEYTVDDSFLVTTPGMQASVGATRFTLGGVEYVVYPTGSGYFDGWAIVKASNAEDNAVLVEHAETTTAVTSGYQSNWLMVEVLSETTALIYQYFPGGYIASYEFTAVDPNAPKPEVKLTYNLKEVAKFTEGLPNKLEARQAVLGKDGKVYMQVKADQNIQVWTKDGKSAETLATSGPAVAIATDDAGNVIVPGAGSAWVTDFSAVSTLKVYPADGSEATEVSVTGLPAGRMDFMSHVAGNILSGDATLYLPANGSNAVTAVKFIDGVQEGDAASIVLSEAVLPADNGTTTYGDATGFLYYKRNLNGGAHYVTVSYDDAMGEFTADSELHVVTPGMYSSNGICKFTMGGIDYVAYNTGSGYYDGWAIVKCSDAEDNAVLVEHPESMTSVTSGFQTNWLMVDVLNETTAMVYQYFPGGYFAAYEFTATEDDTPEPPAPAYPANVYVAGHLENASWDPAYDGYKMTATANEGEYSIENVVVVEADAEANKGFGYFAFTTAVGTWDDVNASDRYGAETRDELIESDKAAKVVVGQNSWKVAAGTYNMVLNLKDMTLTITKLSGVDAVEAAVKVIAGNGVINVIGEAQTIEVYNASGALVSANVANVECAPGIYLVRVDGNVTKVVVR